MKFLKSFKIHLVFLLLLWAFTWGLSTQMPALISGGKQALEWGDHESEPIQKPVTIVMTGDLMLGRYIGTLIERKGEDFPFTFMGDLLAHIRQNLGVEKLDIVAGNLEGPITENQIAYGDMVFRFNPSTAAQLKSAGFTLFQLANNHIFNQGKAGFTETQMHLRNAGLNYFGEADTPRGETSFWSQEINGIKLGFLGLNDVDFKLDMDQTAAEIERLDQQVDVLIVGIHWGYEYEKTARENIVKKAHILVESGADFIWGTHPHVVRNHEDYLGRSVYYSLGNFVFDQYWSQETQKGLVLGLRIEREKKQEFPFKFTILEVPVELVNQGEPKNAAENGVLDLPTN